MKILDSIERLRVGLDYHLARHNLLTANLTHVDTPGFKPLDLQRTEDFRSALHVAMTPAAGADANATSGASATFSVDGASNGNAQSVSATTAQVSEPWRVIEDKGAPAGLDGNAVSVEREAVKIATNHIRYETVASLVQNELASMSWAANDGK